MSSRTSAEQINPHDVAIAPILQAYEQIGRTDQQLQRVDEQAYKLEQDATRHPSDHPADPGRRPRRGMRLWGGTGLLLASCVAVFAWHSFGDAAKLIVGRWVSEGIPVSSLLLAKQEPPAKPRPQTVGVA
jgi:hypothetical protein